MIISIMWGFSIICFTIQLLNISNNNGDQILVFEEVLVKRNMCLRAKINKKGEVLPDELTK